MKAQRWSLSLLLAGMAVTLSAQTPKPAFEVASVKKQLEFVVPVKGAGSGAPPAVRAAFRAANATVGSLVQFGWEIRDFQVIGGPEWVRKDLFEINARAASEVPNDQMRLMVQSLLEDRFRLVVHKEQREMQTSELVVARQDGRLGPKLEKCADPDRRSPLMPVRIPRGGLVERMRCVPMSTIVKLAVGMLRRPVEDKTALTGLWNFELVYAIEIESDAPSFQTALQDQLGLRVESTRGPVDVIVIDSVQQPTEN
jgi:uncharacterized protein (TIGR03435 family)